MPTRRMNRGPATGPSAVAFPSAAPGAAARSFDLLDAYEVLRILVDGVVEPGVLELRLEESGAAVYGADWERPLLRFVEDEHALVLEMMDPDRLAIVRYTLRSRADLARLGTRIRALCTAAFPGPRRDEDDGASEG